MQVFHESFLVTYWLYLTFSIGDASLQGLIGNLDQQQLLQLLGSGQGMSGLSSLAGLASRGSSASSTTATASRPSDSEPPAKGSSK